MQKGFSCGSDGKESACNEGDPGSISGLGKSPGEGTGNPLQCSCLEKSMNRGAWRATVHGIAESDMTVWLTHCSKVWNLQVNLGTMITVNVYCLFLMLWNSRLKKKEKSSVLSSKIQFLFFISFQNSSWSLWNPLNKPLLTQMPIYMESFYAYVSIMIWNMASHSILSLGGRNMD